MKNTLIDLSADKININFQQKLDTESEDYKKAIDIANHILSEIKKISEKENKIAFKNVSIGRNIDLDKIDLVIFLLREKGFYAIESDTKKLACPCLNIFTKK